MLEICEPGHWGSESLRPVLVDATAGLGLRAAGVMIRLGGATAIVVSHGLEPDAIDAYIRHWHRMDPCLAALGGPVEARAVRGTSLVGGGLLQRSSFHHGWLVPNGLGPSAFADISYGGGAAAWLFAYRAEGERTFSRSDLLTLKALAGALSLSFQSRALSGGALAAAAILRNAPVPLLLLRTDATLVWANAAGTALTQVDGPLRRAGSHVLPQGVGAEAFSRVLEATATSGRPRALRLDGRAGPTAAKLHPLRTGSGRATAVVLVAPRENTPLPDTDTLSSVLGLTRVQAEVATLLCRGTETQDMATRLGISPHTLNGYLGRIYDRLGVTNRVQAVVRLLGVSAALALLSDDPGSAERAEPSLESV
ncbi:PAS and helix-turn-helix domain-containing protein [Roseomonas sp. AR75]|uniref:helix-turn-helix transcriptional regulator n=1 Tax=Roseomonas sp. AR75 TaxID=2562311 RepID=UPI00148531F8|nr:PAS and helix-turn-helix domain-containing protein [Roseomonas sp. AR75]